MVKLNFEKSLPDVVQVREKRRETEREISRNLAAIKEHWAALLDIPEISEKVKDINLALDYEDLLLSIDKKITEVQAMPLPITDKNEVIQEWKEIKRNIQFHCEKLVEAEEYFPCGYVTMEEGKPETVDISPKDRKELEIKGATVAVPDAAKELYQVFMKVVEAAQEYEKYQFNKNLNVRDFISTITHIRDAEEFAKNWISGTWKRF